MTASTSQIVDAKVFNELIRWSAGPKPRNQCPLPRPEPKPVADPQQAALDTADSIPVAEAAVQTPVAEAAVQTPVAEAAVQTPVAEAAVQTPVAEAAVQTPVAEAAVQKAALVCEVASPVGVWPVLDRCGAAAAWFGGGRLSRC